MFPNPLPFQEKAVDQLRDGRREGHIRQVLCAPTGAGKTYCGLKLISESIAKGKRAMFVCDRVSLIEQTSRVADRYGLSDHGIIQAGHWRSRRHEKFQIASVQTLLRLSRMPDDMNLVVVDECHTMYPKFNKWLLDSGITAVGLSATPFSKGLGAVYSKVVNAATMHELTEQGVIVPIRAYAGKRPDMSSARVTKFGEWVDDDASKCSKMIVGDVVESWHRLGEGLKTICFGVDINHVNEMVGKFNSSGVKAAAYTSNTPEEMRKELIEDFSRSSPQNKILISVDALAKGFDVPDIGCLIDARPLRNSFATAVQIWGRALRSFNGKTEAIILDHSGNLARFAERFEELYYNGCYTLDDGKKKKDAKKEKHTQEPGEMSSCPQCGHQPFRKHCMSCGYERRRKSDVVEVEGKMVEFRVNGHESVKSINQLSDAQLWREVYSYARQRTASDRVKTRALCLFKDMRGKWPSGGLADISPDPSEISTPVMNRIRSLNIAYAQRMGGAQKKRA